MAENTNTLLPETQKQRWLKYGGNVAVVSIAAVVLAGFLVYIAQDNRWRKDTTAGGAYSLKPQTVKLIRELPEKVRVIGLFSQAKEASDLKVQNEADSGAVQYQQVADLLQEYQTKSGGKVTAEMIDYKQDPGKVDQLFNEVMKKYGNDVKKYADVMEAYPKTLEQINKLTTEEIDALGKLKIEDRTLSRAIGEVVVTVQFFPALLEEIRDKVKKQLELKVPDYRGAADAIRGGLEGLNERIDAVLNEFKKVQANPKAPKDFKDYMAGAEPRYQAMKKASDELLKKMEGLGQIKQLDELRNNRSDSIVVMGEKDMKVLPREAIFKEDDSRMVQTDARLRQRFAGEQQVTTALFSLTNPTKRKIAFVRNSGPPLTLRLPMFNYTGPYATLAEQLREMDFEILEKDVSGAWAMQAMQMQMQGMPLPPEATDDQLKDATWLVFDREADPRAAMRNPNPESGQLKDKLAQHLKAGGSAMVLVEQRGEDLPVLKEWGIEVKPQYMIVHEKVPTSGARDQDIVSDWHREQPVFILNQYGDHIVTRPINSLDGFFFFLVPVSTTPTKDVKLTSLLPIPSTPRIWADRQIDDLREMKEVQFTPKKDDEEGDLTGSFFAGAIAEKDNARLVVLGSTYFGENRWIRMADPEISKAQRRPVARFPGNRELFLNSVLWLSKMDTMIAISPTALEVPRVAQMSDTTLAVWRIGVLPIGLPLIVLAAGTFVWLKRRD